jgi:hypothetical protein
MRRAGLAMTSISILLVGVIASTPAGGAPPPFEHLDPGGQPSLDERVPVNVVFVGYERDQVDEDAFRLTLPEDYEPIVRSRGLYDIEEKLGITYEYDYNLRFAGDEYEDRFFSRLTELATRTSGVEAWLANNAPDGVDTRRNTVYLVNWLNRPDFVFHVYTKTDEPDPDTGYNFGEQRESRKLVAWGGTTANGAAS